MILTRNSDSNQNIRLQNHLKLFYFEYLPLALDVNGYNDGLLVYSKEDIQSKELWGINEPNDTQVLSMDINIRKTKWLIVMI